MKNIKITKTITVISLTIFIIATCLVGCGNTTNTAKTANADSSNGDIAAASTNTSKKLDESKIKTMGDVYAYKDGGNSQEGFTTDKYVIVIENDGISYRAIADMPEDVSDKIWNLEYDDTRDAKIRELISPLEVKSFENLTKLMPSNEELSKYVGKKGQDLFDEGWTYWYFNLENMEAGMNYGMFSYIVTFDYDGPQMENSDDFNFYEKFKDLTIKSVTCEGVGDAVNIE